MQDYHFARYIHQQAWEALINCHWGSEDEYWQRYTAVLEWLDRQGFDLLAITCPELYK